MSRVKFAIRLDNFGLEMLRGIADQLGVPIDELVEMSLRYYLDERRTGRPATRLPAFRRFEAAPDSERAVLQVSAALNDRVVRTLRRDAGEQGVSIATLAEHAVMLLIADIDRGRALPSRLRAGRMHLRRPTS